jgi:uncharacterized repeat protein (TIGR03806 family)
VIACCGVLLTGAAALFVPAPAELAAPRESPPLDGGSLPETLSETGLFASVEGLIPVEGFYEYELNLPFWSDGASKRRWIMLPAGARVEARRDHETWALPEGTVLLKHFETVGGRRLELRVLVMSPGGMASGGTYRWRADGQDADLVRDAASEPVSITGEEETRPWHYLVPADCAKCHTPEAGGALGITTAQLNRETAGPDQGPSNQLQTWKERGVLAGDIDPAGLPRFAGADDELAPVETRARAWLAVNCAMCHRPGVAPAGLDLRFDTPLERQGLVDARVRLDLGIDRARMIAPNDPWRSMTVHRVEQLDGNRMPPLAYERVDVTGARLLREWIASLGGPPVLQPPRITPVSGTGGLPVMIELAHPDPAAVVRFTLDGSPPNEASPAYAEVIRIDKPTTIRARAFRDGHTRSIAVHRTFTR